VWSANSTDGKIDGWNVERGTTQDIVFGARSSLEDEGYISFYETHFYKSGMPAPLQSLGLLVLCTHIEFDASDHWPLRIHHLVGRRWRVRSHHHLYP
jgi:hypothetical protein